LTRVPLRPKLYHITHVNNLAAIVEAGGLFSDATMIARGGPASSIGMGSIKRRRLELPVRCYPGDHVGEYVPFYFCPRSIMLYLLYMANHPELNYSGGQEPIVHLEADLGEVVQWADSQGVRWAFTLANAGAAYTEFRNNLERLEDVNWEAVAATDFRNALIKEGKQAEFLLREFLPWELVQRVGVITPKIHSQVTRILAGARHRPSVEVTRAWYY